MSTKKVKKTVTKSKINTVINTTKNVVNTTTNVAKKVNDIALKTTEEVVLESIAMTSQWQEVANKAIKGGFKLATNQQNLFFDTLETFKSQLINGKKRINKLFA